MALGIHELDEVTLVGLPRDRPTLVSGYAGCGKIIGDLLDKQRVLVGMDILPREDRAA